MGHVGRVRPRITVDRLVLWVLCHGEISCFSDDAGQEKGWSMYTDMTTAPPTPLPTPCPTSHTVVSYGEWDVVVIVSKPNYPSICGSNQVCDIRF